MTAHFVLFANYSRTTSQSLYVFTVHKQTSQSLYLFTVHKLTGQSLYFFTVHKHKLIASENK